MEKVNAPGGKSNASLELKLRNPLTITHSSVTSMPTHSTTVNFPTALMPRYSRAITRIPTATLTMRVPVTPMSCQKYPTYCAKPM